MTRDILSGIQYFSSLGKILARVFFIRKASAAVPLEFPFFRNSGTACFPLQSNAFMKIRGIVTHEAADVRLVEYPAMKHNETSKPVAESRRLVSLKTLSKEFDADRSSVRRWLDEAGVQPVVFGDAKNAAIRFKRDQVEAWLRQREQAS